MNVVDRKFTTSCFTSSGPTWRETMDRLAVNRWPSLREIRIRDELRNTSVTRSIQSSMSRLGPLIAAQSELNCILISPVLTPSTYASAEEVLFVFEAEAGCAHCDTDVNEHLADNFRACAQSAAAAGKLRAVLGGPPRSRRRLFACRYAHGRTSTEQCRGQV